MNRVITILLSLFLFSCSSFKYTRKAAIALLNDSALLNAHIGISIYEPGKRKFIFKYQGEKYFVPASNIKIVTCYETMKHLGDSLKGLRYTYDRAKDEYHFYPTADPTFLHPDFKNDGVFDFYSAHKKSKLIFHSPLSEWQVTAWGQGWEWDDYEGDYMAERSPFPIYGNVVTFKYNRSISVENPLSELIIFPKRFATGFRGGDFRGGHFMIHRDLYQNNFFIGPSSSIFSSDHIPFVTQLDKTFRELISDALQIDLKNKDEDEIVAHQLPDSNKNKYNLIYSRPTDSMLKPMMYRSDNFYAEQSLLMVSNELLGLMNDQKIIDTLLNTDLVDLPQKPNWVDGSGLSRYNLFSPDDFIAVLNKMQNEFSMERIKAIFPFGNSGSLTNYFKNEQQYIFAKTGSMSHVVALSGFLYTRSKRLFLFSILVNNNQAPISKVRRVVERFIESVWKEN